MEQSNAAPAVMVMQDNAGSIKHSGFIRPFPDPTPVLFLLAAGSAILFWVAGVGWGALLLPGIFLLPIAVYLLSTNIYLALAALVIPAAMPHYFVEISGAKARPEHIATGLLCLAAIFIYKREDKRPVWMFLDLFVVAIIFMNIFSSIFMSIAPSQTFKWSMQQTLVILPYFLLRLLANNRRRFRQAMGLMLLAGTMAAAYGILCFYSYRLFGTEFGVAVGQYGEIPGVYGSQFEANLLGSYCGACLIIMLFMYFREKNRKLLWASAITFAGMVISLSRAALGATLLALAVLIIYSLRKRMVTRQTLRQACLVLAGVSVVLAASIAPLYLERFSTLALSNPTADDTTKIRVLGLGVALERTLEHPLLGAGTNSFQLDFDYAEIGYTGVDVGGWIGNTELRVWHDTGVVGLGFLLVFLWLLFRRALRATNAGSPELMGLLLAGLVYCVSFQATDATILSFPWVHLGMVATATSMSGPELT
jgi:O-antigen ligase/polysaccharide polymerase Wzy-like membrane protein